MRLWQKIFLLTLCLTALAANAISLVLLVRNQANSLSLAKERVRTICDGAAAELGHLIQEKREADGCLLVTERELEDLFSKLQLNSNGQLIVREDGEDTESGEGGQNGEDAESGEGGQNGEGAESGEGGQNGEGAESGEGGQNGEDAESGEGRQNGEGAESGEIGKNVEGSESGEDGQSVEDREDVWENEIAVTLVEGNPFDVVRSFGNSPEVGQFSKASGADILAYGNYAVAAPGYRILSAVVKEIENLAADSRHHENPSGPTLLSETSGSIRTMLVEENGNQRICSGTTAFWEGRFYRVEVSTDVSELFGSFREDLIFSQWMSGAVSLLIAAVLLFSILYLTWPLKRLEAATKQIAAGEYGYRVRAKGHDEIAELSGHMDEMAAEIEANIRQVEALARGRETFIANMAHELKTPLTSILGFADIMTIKSDMGETERREYAGVIAAEARRLKLLSSRLMELISIQETELALRPVDFGELTERALEVFAPVCGERQCTVRKKLQPLQVEADEVLLTSLVLNLLDNALKASAPGQEIAVTLKEQEGSALLAIWDYGIGIPESELERVTEAFYMVDKARSRSSGGSGVGLALCKAIAEAHHGTLKIESKEHCGTRVSVVLPCAGDKGNFRERCRTA